jgi:DNA-binding helix-hairpin-helix protein with protein kinase domain
MARAVLRVVYYEPVIGDINAKSMLVAKQAIIKLIDCDSFQI